MKNTKKLLDFILDFKIVYLPEYGLYFLSFSLWLFIGNFCWLYSLLWDWHNTKKDKYQVRISEGKFFDMTVTYISGGTDCNTGMIGLLKNLCLYTKEENVNIICNSNILSLPVGSLDISLSLAWYISIL